MSDSLQSSGLQPTRLLYPWDSPGKNTGVGGHALLHGIFQYWQVGYLVPSGKPTEDLQFSSVQSQSHVLLFATPWTATRQASLSITNSLSLLTLMSIESVMLYNHLILCHPLLLPPSIFPSIRVFSNESVLCSRWPKYWSFRFSISSSNEYSGLISFKMDWLDLLAVQGTLTSLQYHSSKASVLQRSAFFIVQHSHPYMTTGKTIVLSNGTLLSPESKYICSHRYPLNEIL